MSEKYNPKFRIKFLRSDTIANTPVEPGNFLINMDNGKILIDILFADDTTRRVNISGGIVYCGTVANYAALQNIQSPTNGDLYNVADTGANYCWSDSDNTWDKLSENIDISGKADISDLANYVSIDELNDLIDILTDAT